MRYLFRFSPPDRASRLSCCFATIKLPFPPRPRSSLHSTLSFILSPLSALPLTGRAAQPPEFSPRDVVGLTWSPLLIPPLSRLAALIRPFLEPSFPRRWLDSDMGVDARPGQPGRSLSNPAPGPPLLSSFSFYLFGRPSERSASLPSAAGIENASPSRPLAAPLTAPFLVDLHASSLEARTWKIGRGQ